MHTLKRPQVNFTQVPNEVLSDKALSLKAKGLYALMFSKPDGWTFYEDTLVAESKDGRDATRAAIDELLAVGWLTRTRGRSIAKQFQPYQYEMHMKPYKAKPQPKTHSGKSNVDAEPQRKTRSGKAAAENPPLINTQSSNTDDSNTKTVPAPSDERNGYAKTLGGVLRERLGGEAPKPRTGNSLAETLEAFNGKVPADWIPMAILMFKLTQVETAKAAEKFVFFYTLGNGRDVRREDIGAWAEAWGKWCRGAKEGAGK